MKAICKHTIGYLLITLVLTSFAPLHAQDSTEDDSYITISGVVKDKNNKKQLEYVNISIPGSTTGTVTNADGGFSFKVKNSLHASKIEVSYLGYFNSIIDLNGKDMENLTIWMTPHVNMLEEVIIHAREPRYLVEEAMQKIPVNYNSKNSLQTGFYRETAQKGRRYINISEAVIDIFKTPYTENAEHDRVQVFKGRKLLSQKASDTLAVKLLGGPNLSIYVDIVKNPDILLDKESLSYYSYRMEEPTTIDNRAQYVISFKPQAILPYALYYGKLYIDKDKLSFTRAEFFLDMDDRNKATQAILRKKPFGLRFKPIEVSYVVNYKDRDGKTYLSYIRNDVRFKCDWKRKLFSTNYIISSEMVVTESRNENIASIPYKMAFKTTESLSDNVSNFTDDDFWGAYNIIEPTESLESAVNKLKKQHQ